jgi:hypothetical protein
VSRLLRKEEKLYDFWKKFKLPDYINKNKKSNDNNQDINNNNNSNSDIDEGMEIRVIYQGRRQPPFVMSIYKCLTKVMDETFCSRAWSTITSPSSPPAAEPASLTIILLRLRSTAFHNLLPEACWFNRIVIMQIPAVHHRQKRYVDLKKKHTKIGQFVASSACYRRSSKKEVEMQFIYQLDSALSLTLNSSLYD